MTASVERPAGEIGEAIGLIDQVARRIGARAFLVGGPVRDLLCGTPPRDLDIAIEGDAGAVARELASRSGSAVQKIDPFLTFKIRPRDAKEIDIATTRRERYPHAGALPVVEPASIEEDLVRRDYSINAIALELATGILIDPTGGVADLRCRLLRALHSKSFIDDPTRILRGFRFAARLQLDWDDETRHWLEDAIQRDALSTVSPERIWRELFNAAGETPRAALALTAIARSGALERVLSIPREPAEQAALERLDRDTTLIVETGADPSLVRLALLFAGSSLDEGRLQGAPLRERSRNLFVSIARDPHRLRHELAAVTDHGTIFEALEAAEAEERCIAALLDPATERLVVRFEEACRTPIVARATDLGAPPGPWIGRALGATKRALFSRVISPGEAAAFARRSALDYLREQDRRT